MKMLLVKFPIVILIIYPRVVHPSLELGSFPSLGTLYPDKLADEYSVGIYENCQLWV
jgi:hypothetical protein